MLEVWYYYVAYLVHVSQCVSKIDNSKLQVLNPLARTELEFLSVELPKVHTPLELLEHYLQLQELLEKGFDVLVFLILPSIDMLTLLLFMECEKFFVRYLKKDIHRWACHTICVLPPYPILLDHVSRIVTKPILWF